MDSSITEILCSITFAHDNYSSQFLWVALCSKTELNDPETVLLIDSWTDQAAIDAHHASPMMKQLAELRDKYDLHMTVERFIGDEYEADGKYIRK